MVFTVLKAPASSALFYLPEISNKEQLTFLPQEYFAMK